MNIGFEGEATILSNSLSYAGRVFICHEGEIDATAQQDIVGLAKGHGIALHFRGREYAAGRAMFEKSLAFICHDSFDKDAIARPIAIGLGKLRCPVWFDEFSLKVGDRLRESIELGLKVAQKCVVLLTPNFLSNKGWPATEVDATFTRELIEDRDLFLPVWYEVTEKQVFEYSPVLANRVAAQWSTDKAKQLEVVHELRRKIV